MAVLCLKFPFFSSSFGFLSSSFINQIGDPRMHGENMEISNKTAAAAATQHNRMRKISAVVVAVVIFWIIIFKLHEPAVRFIHQNKYVTNDFCFPSPNHFGTLEMRTSHNHTYFTPMNRFIEFNRMLGISFVRCFFFFSFTFVIFHYFSLFRWLLRSCSVLLILFWEFFECIYILIINDCRRQLRWIWFSQSMCAHFRWKEKQ